jgi:hypothetical protein
MKNKIHPLHKEVCRVGTGQFDHGNIKTLEAIAVSLVAILSLTAGTIYGSMLF